MRIEESIVKDWDGWDGDQECMQYYGGILQIDTGKFKKGDKIMTVALDMVNSKCEIYTDPESGTPTESFPIKLIIGN